MPADPSCPDLDALERELAEESSTGALLAIADALPGLIAEVRRLRAMLSIVDAAERLDDEFGHGDVEAVDIFSAASDVVDAVRAWRALAAPARTAEAT